MTDEKKTIEPMNEFTQDTLKEREFLKTAKEKGIDTELDIMKRVYNEQLETLVRLRFDMEIYDYLLVAEPEEKSHIEEKKKSDMAIRRKRKAIEIIRKQIQLLMSKKGGKSK